MPKNFILMTLEIVSNFNVVVEFGGGELSCSPVDMILG